MGHGDLLFNIEINGGSMNPLSPEQILRNLEHGYFMTHQEQSEAAQYIRQLQQENLTLLGKIEQPRANQVRANEFIAMASKHPSLVGTPVIWAEYPTRLEHIFVAHDVGCAVNGYGECDCFGGVKA